MYFKKKIEHSLKQFISQSRLYAFKALENQFPETVYITRGKSIVFYEFFHFNY